MAEPDLTQLVDPGDLSRIRDATNQQDSHTAIENAVRVLSGGVNRALLRLMRMRANRVSNPTLTTPGKPIDGDVWVEASGVSPARTVKLQLRDQGATVTVVTLVY